MPRPLRLISAGDFYHVTARGNFRQDVFFSPNDRLRYLDLLHKRCADTQLDLLGYCLMTNHVHLLVLPREHHSLAACMQHVQGRYSAYLNRIRHRPSGHVWQARYNSCPVESERFAQVLSYIELNPVRANLVRRPEQFAWSTARFHMDLEIWPKALQRQPWTTQYTPREWTEVLQLGLSPEDSNAIRTATRYGVPYGSRAFVSRFQHGSGRHFPFVPKSRAACSV